MSSESFHLQQMSTTNKLGNALLSNMFALKSTENRKIANISNLLKKAAKQIERYRSEKAKLQTLQIAVCHLVLSEKRCDEYQGFCKDAEKSMLKIEKILNQHLKFSASKLLSKDDFEQIEREQLIEKLESVLDESEEVLAVDKVNTGVSKKLQVSRELESLLDSTMKLVREAAKNVDQTEVDAVENLAKVLEVLADR